MFSNIHRLSMFTVTTTVMLFSVNSAQAQCSRGSGGGNGPTLSVASTGLLSPRAAYSGTANNLMAQRQLAARQQTVSQQQFLSMRQPTQSQSTQQNLYAMRLARAEAKRSKRAARIAALRDKYGSDSGSAVMLASKVRTTNPFE